MNDFRYYQREAAKTIAGPLLDLSSEQRLSYFTLGLTSEAGEVAGKVKKVIRGDKPLDQAREELKGEIGDVLWYLAMVSEELELNLSEMASLNIKKLADRKARGKIQGDGDDR